MATQLKSSTILLSSRSFFSWIFQLLRAPSPSRPDFLIDISGISDWESTNCYCHCNQTTSAFSNLFLYKQFSPNRSLVHFSYCSKMIVTFLTDNKFISLPACAAQIFMSIFLITTEFSFLVVMSCDCYVAICHPMHYGLIITPCLCAQAAGGTWACGFVYSAIHTGYLFRLPFTESNVIPQYFCEIPQILRISSSNVQISENVVLAISASIFLVPCAFLFISYINILSVLLRMHSVEAHNKALSTCTPQLAILILFIISGFTVYLGPTAKEASLSNLLLVMFYTMVPPFINLIIYSLQNREVNSALCRMCHRYF